MLNLSTYFFPLCNTRPIYLYFLELSITPLLVSDVEKLSLWNYLKDHNWKHVLRQICGCCLCSGNRALDFWQYITCMRCKRMKTALYFAG